MNTIPTLTAELNVKVLYLPGCSRLERILAPIDHDAG